MKKIIGNWKCNQKLVDVIKFCDILNDFQYDSKNFQIGIAVPDVWLFVVKTYLKNATVYAQDVDYIEYGSYTGRTSYQHLQDIGLNHVILGHSEVRIFSNNTNKEINKKVLKCIDKGFEVILCIGEPIEVYENKTIEQYLIRQIVDAIASMPINKMSQLTIAYEPIWAIGSNKTPTNEEIEDIINIIKQFVSINFSANISVLYGGSVNLNNIEHLSKIKNLDGFLIGTASLNPNTFIDLVRTTKWNVS